MKCPICESNLQVDAVIDNCEKTTTAVVECKKCQWITSIAWMPEQAPIVFVIPGKNKV